MRVFGHFVAELGQDQYKDSEVLLVAGPYPNKDAHKRLVEFQDNNPDKSYIVVRIGMDAL